MTKLKSTLSKRTATLISQALQTLGASQDAYYYIEEQLYFDEAESVKEFIEWIEKNHHRASKEMRFVEENFPNLYKNYFLKNK